MITAFLIENKITLSGKKGIEKKKNPKEKAKIFKRF